MSKYILAYDMCCFLSCTRYSLWVYQCSLVYRFMINLFSIYKKALLIPRNGLDELPDITLFGLLIYWNDLQLSSHVFPTEINCWWMKLVRDRGSCAAFGISGKDGVPASKKWCQEGSCPWWALLLLWVGRTKGDRLCSVLPPKHARTPCKAKLMKPPAARGCPTLQAALLVNMLDMYVSGIRSMETSAIFRDCFCSSAC